MPGSTHPTAAFVYKSRGNGDYRAAANPAQAKQALSPTVVDMAALAAALLSATIAAKADAFPPEDWMRLTISTFVLASAVILGRPATGAAQLPAETFDGRPTYKEGKALGYFVWRDGDTWKRRWMTFGANHKFNGRIVVDKIEQEEEHSVLWLTNTNDDVDGVDVKVTDGATGLRLMLMIDGPPRPSEVEVGKANFKPGEMPLRVKLK